ncbi:MAG: hypothetical protein U9Q05_01180 [Thermodesulfobacteriota bacterium]|nr:hypothetical protein [Thermodesulfobacteriota bacterium]
MKKNVSGPLFYLLALGLLFIGSGVVYYAFELVSVPHVREYNEGWVIIIGLILAAAGVGGGVYKIRKAWHRPATPEAT